MALPDRYHLNRPIPEAALASNRAWLIAYDEEGIDGQSEATIKPNELGDLSLPGFVTIDATLADGAKRLGLVGGDFGVASLDDLDSMRLYQGNRVWSFELDFCGRGCATTTRRCARPPGADASWYFETSFVMASVSSWLKAARSAGDRKRTSVSTARVARRLPAFCARRTRSANSRTIRAPRAMR